MSDVSLNGIGAGSVLGIDVGFSPTRRTTCFCALDWDRSKAVFRYRLTTSDPSQRRAALSEVVELQPLLGVAVDGPLTHGLRLVPHYRAADAILSRGVLQKRGKPGQTSSPVGQQLHRHATDLANLVLELAVVAPSTHVEPIHNRRIVEAFPNLFLGSLIDECDLPTLTRDASDRYWEALVDKSERLVELIQCLLPGRILDTNLRAITNHEHRAGVICALTALSVVAGDYVGVGDDRDGDIILPPRRLWGANLARSGAWFDLALRENVAAVKGLSRGASMFARARIGASPISWEECAFMGCQ